MVEKLNLSVLISEFSNPYECRWDFAGSFSAELTDSVEAESEESFLTLEGEFANNSSSSLYSSSPLMAVE